MKQADDPFHVKSLENFRKGNIPWRFHQAWLSTDQIFHVLLLLSNRKNDQSADLRLGDAKKEGPWCGCCCGHIHVWAFERWELTWREVHTGVLGVSGCCYTDCKCAAGLVAVLLGLQGQQLSVHICILDSSLSESYGMSSHIVMFSLSSQTWNQSPCFLSQCPSLTTLHHQLSTLVPSIHSMASLYLSFRAVNLYYDFQGVKRLHSIMSSARGTMG